MITITAKRKKDGVECPAVIHKLSPLEALIFLTEVELGFGAQVKALLPTQIITVCGVLSCVDTSIFEGPEDEMSVLFETAVLVAHLQQNTDLLAHAAAKASEILGAKGNPLLLNFGSSVFIGQGQISLALMLALGVKTESELEAGAGQKVKDILAAHELVQQGGITFGQALAL